MQFRRERTKRIEKKRKIQYKQYVGQITNFMFHRSYLKFTMLSAACVAVAVAATDRSSIFMVVENI